MAVSERFLAALSSSHTLATAAWLLDANGNPSTLYEIVDGNYSVSASQNVWRQVTLTLAVNSQAPADLLDVTSVLRVQRGIRFGISDTEWVTLGDFYLQEVTEQVDKGVVQVTGFDIGVRVEDYRLITPYAPINDNQVTLTFVDAIKDLITVAVPEATFEVDAGIDTSLKPDVGTVLSGSRWGAVNTLAKSIGCVVHTTPSGSFRLHNVIADVAVDPWTIDYGPHGVMVSASLLRSRREQYNGVVVSFSTPTATGTALVVDNDPLSPTYWNGPFGKKPSPTENLTALASNEAATKAALALLEQKKGFVRSLKFGSIVRPDLQPLDRVKVRVPDGSLETYTIDSVSFSIGGAEMQCETRLVRSESEDD